MKYNNTNNILRNAKKLSVDDMKKYNAIAYEKACMAETSYNNAKDQGKLWTPAQKAESKAKKAAARKEKRLAKKA